MSETHRSLLEAVSFAARAHRHQVRKDGQTPYASHVFRVCLILRHIFGIDDERALTAAILHDSIEDTATDHDDIAERFGAEVADWVALLTKDTRMPEAPRESAYLQQLSQAPWQVQVCKLADVYDNLMDSENMPAEKRKKTLNNSRRYLDALRENLPTEARKPFEYVEQLLTGFSQ